MEELQLLILGGLAICKAISNLWGKVYRREFLTNQNITFPEGISHMEDTVFNLQAFKKADNIYFCNSVFYMDCFLYSIVRNDDERNTSTI